MTLHISIHAETMTKSPAIKPASLSLLKHLLFGGILFSAGIGFGQELTKASLEQLAKIPASKFTKVINSSKSPDKRLAVVLGSPDGSAPKWEEETLLEEAQCRNYLVDLKKDRVTGILDGNHFGTGVEYNHESVSHHWSPDGRWLVETQSWRWGAFICSVHRVDADGKLTGRLDFLETADQAVIRRVREKGGTVPDGENSGYAITMSVTGIDNDGILTTSLYADSSKSKTEDGDFLGLLVVAKVSQSEKGELAAKLTQVKPAEE